MKKQMAVILILALLMTGCGKKAKIVVNALEHTISDGTNTYEYSDTIDGDTRTIIIRYPDGAEYIWTQNGGVGQGHMQYGPNTESFVDGPTLLKAILDPQDVDEPEKLSPQWGLMIIGILVAAFGLWSVCCPVAVWDTFMRWRFSEDPGEYALTRIICGGIGEITAGLGIILTAIFG